MINPFETLNGAFDRAAERAVEREKILVSKGFAAYPRVMVSTLVRFALAIGVMIMQATGWPSQTLGNMLCGVIAAEAGMAYFRRATAYRSGWVQGRLAMVKDLERFEHNVPVTQDYVLTHDLVHVMGIEAPTPDSPEDLT